MPVPEHSAAAPRSLAKEGFIFLPRTMDAWPWSRQINPYYEEVSQESNEWFYAFKPFTNKSQEAFDKCDFGRLASLAYPIASKAHLRTGCDLMNLFFVIDEYTDVEPKPVVEEMIDIVLDALNNPEKPRPKGEILLGQVAKEFWQRAIANSTPASQKYFLKAFTAYLKSVVVQAGDRDDDYIRTIPEYFATRRENIGAKPSYYPGAMSLDLPDEVLYHPIIKELEYIIADLIILDNDLASYNKEQANSDDRHNVVTIVMHHKQMDRHDAIAWIAQYHKEVEERFFEVLRTVPSFGEVVDKQLQEYLLHLANWPRCNDCWNFESGRYFGSRGLEFQKSRFIPVMPRVCSDTSAKRENVVIPLVDL